MHPGSARPPAPELGPYQPTEKGLARLESSQPLSKGLAPPPVLLVCLLHVRLFQGRGFPAETAASRPTHPPVTSPLAPCSLCQHPGNWSTVGPDQERQPGFFRPLPHSCTLHRIPIMFSVTKPRGMSHPHLLPASCPNFCQSWEFYFQSPVESPTATALVQAPRPPLHLIWAILCLQQVSAPARPFSLHLHAVAVVTFLDLSL